MTEPVAWLHIQGNHFEASDRQLFDDEIERGWAQKPLYTHPVKELTDEKILIVWTSSNFVRYTETGHIDEIFFNKFARAILRKAQEK